MPEAEEVDLPGVDIASDTEAESVPRLLLWCSWKGIFRIT